MCATPCAATIASRRYATTTRAAGPHLSLQLWVAHAVQHRCDRLHSLRVAPSRDAKMGRSIVLVSISIAAASLTSQVAAGGAQIPPDSDDAPLSRTWMANTKAKLSAKLVKLGIWSPPPRLAPPGSMNVPTPAPSPHYHTTCACNDGHMECNNWEGSCSARERVVVIPTIYKGLNNQRMRVVPPLCCK